MLIQDCISITTIRKGYNELLFKNVYPYTTKKNSKFKSITTITYLKQQNITNNRSNKV